MRKNKESYLAKKVEALQEFVIYRRVVKALFEFMEEIKFFV
jgi:hypothetical protein